MASKSEKNAVKVTVSQVVQQIKESKSSRFSKSDFQMLIYAVLADEDFKAKKYLLKNHELVEEDYSINNAMRVFLDKMLKHVGISDPGERERAIDSFKYSWKDIEWVMEAVDEAMYIYTECDKNMRMFRDKMLNLSVKKMVRSGKYAGMTTYKKTVVNRALSLEKAKK